jgi:type IV secretory pathway VirB10-like protein
MLRQSLARKIWGVGMAPTTRRGHIGSPIPAAGFMPPPVPGSTSVPKAAKKATRPSAKATRPSAKATRPLATKTVKKTGNSKESIMALRTAAREAEAAAKTLLGLSKNLKRQAHR